MWWPPTWSPMGTGPARSWCCWKRPPERGHLQLPGGARQPGAPPEPALGHGPDPTVRGEWGGTGGAGRGIGVCWE